MIAKTETSPGFRRLGRTVNTEYALAADDVMVVIPDAGLKDDEASARANIEFQQGYATRIGRRCAVVVLLSRLLSQDAGARRVYAQGMDPALFFASALVVSNPLSRAMGSFFLGLTRPRTPTRLFDTVEAALAWVESLRPA